MSEKIKLFIVAGEKSGDNHAGEAIKALMQVADVETAGTGGPLLKSLGQKQYYDINDLSVIGLDEALKKIKFLLGVKDRLLEAIISDRPDAVILVDYPGFNLRFAKFVKELGIPVIYFISPTFWVWNYKRVHKLRMYCDLVMCIYPFEPEILKKEGVNAVFVGNPLKGQISYKCGSKEEFLSKGHFDGTKRVIGLLPGSRRREVESLLPVMVRAAKVMPEYDFVLGAADTLDEETFRKHIRGTNIRLATHLTHDIMKYSDILWVCSGTATLEAAIIGTPMILMYKTGFLTYTLGRMLVKVKYIGMPNIIMKKAVIPELIQSDASARNLINFTEKIENSYEQVKSDLAQVGEYFPDTDFSENAAKEIYSFVTSCRQGK